MPQLLNTKIIDGKALGENGVKTYKFAEVKVQ